MTHAEIVKKLIGPVQPIGQSSEDETRLQNLKKMTELISELVLEVESVYYQNKHSQEYSVKHASNFAKIFLNELTSQP